MSTRYAPIAYFAFNRPKHTARSLAALAANPEASETDLHVFIDGPRHSDDSKLVEEVATIAKAISGFRTVEIVASDSNKGLYAAITSGVSRVVSSAGRVIVVEDDIVASPCFLAYLNDGLNRYASDHRVGSIHAYSPPITGLPDYFFLRGGDCWGWATWEDRWLLYRSDTLSLIEEIVSSGQLDVYLNIFGHHSLVHLVRRAENRNSSWASNWHASLFLQNRLTLHPGCSYVENIGNDGSGTHSAASDIYRTRVSTTYHGISSIPVLHDEASAIRMRDFMDGSLHETFAMRVKRNLVTSIYRWKATQIRSRQKRVSRTRHVRPW